MTQLYFNKKQGRYYAQEPKCEHCKKEIQTVCFFRDMTLSQTKAIRQYFCQQCIYEATNNPYIKHESRGFAQVFSQLSEIPKDCIIIPLRPCMPQKSSMHTVWDAATPEFDKKYNSDGTSPQIIDHTKHAGRDQCEQITSDHKKLIEEIKRKDTVADDDEVAKILEAKQEVELE